MSRVGKAPIAIPQGVEVKISDGQVAVKGPKGELKRSFRPEVSLALEGGWLRVFRRGESKMERSLHGLTRTLVSNMVTGVSQGFRRDLDLEGVGYRAAMSGPKLVLALGFTHPVEVAPPSGIIFSVEGNTKVAVAGADKELVGEVAARLRRLRPAEPYKGKGIRYHGEIIRRKAGKAGKVGAKK